MATKREKAKLIALSFTATRTVKNDASVLVLDDATYTSDLTVIYAKSQGATLGGLELQENSGLLVALQNLSGTAYSTKEVQPGNLTLEDFTQGNSTYIQLAGGNAVAGNEQLVYGILSELTSNGVIEDLPRSYVSLSYLPDMSGNCFPELVALAAKADGQPQVIIKDAFDKTLIRKMSFLSSEFDLIDVSLIDDMNSNGADEIMVLGRNRVNGKIKAQIRDSLTKEKINDVWFPK